MRADINPPRLCNGVELPSYCGLATCGPNGEIVLINRQDGSVDFDRNWADYKNGFGNADGEFWLGLDCMNYLTSQSEYSLAVTMSDFEDNSYEANFASFSVGPESENYRLSVSGYDGTSSIGYGLTYHNGAPFTTYDNDNDEHEGNCADNLLGNTRGGYWFRDCYYSLPTGPYNRTPGQSGIFWLIVSESCKTMTFTIIPV